jgi:hypothetical protein
MNFQVLAAMLVMSFMVGLLIEATIFYFRHVDPACTYKLFAVRDKIIRLSVDGKIQRSDPFFDAVYQNVTTLLRCSRIISGPRGWHLATAIGQHLAHYPQDAVSLQPMPKYVPEEMKPVIDELRTALQFLVSNHFGIFLQMDASKRESARMQKEQARKLLAQIPNQPCHA